MKLRSRSNDHSAQRDLQPGTDNNIFTLQPIHINLEFTSAYSPTSNTERWCNYTTPNNPMFSHILEQPQATTSISSHGTITRTLPQLLVPTSIMPTSLRPSSTTSKEPAKHVLHWVIFLYTYGQHKILIQRFNRNPRLTPNNMIK